MNLKENVEFIDEVHYNEVISLIDSSHLGLSIIPPIKAYRVSSPTKVVEYLSRGMPAVVNEEIEDQCKVIHQSGRGFVTPYNVTDIVIAIKKLINNIDHLKRMGFIGRKWVLENRNYNQLVSDLKHYYLESIKN